MHEVVGWDQIENAAMARASRRTLLVQGRQLFGEPSDRTLRAINAINDADRLERMLDVILTLKSWKALLAVK